MGSFDDLNAFASEYFPDEKGELATLVDRENDFKFNDFLKLKRKKNKNG